MIHRFGAPSGVTPDGLPGNAAALKARLDFPLAWHPGISDLARWRQLARDKVLELTWQRIESCPFEPEVLAEQDRGNYTARRLAFSLGTDSRAHGLLLVPKGQGPFPAAVLYHDHGANFAIGKEKLIEPWGDASRHAAARAWSEKYFEGVFPGDELARRGFVVFATDALGWSDRGELTYEMQQALAANLTNLGSSLAGLMAFEDMRAAEFVASLPEVDASRIASLGFSMGAFRSWQVAALSPHISAAAASNWMATACGLMTPGNNQLRGASAWHMTHPGLLRFLDYPDVASLAAPKPVLMMAGEQDPLFPPESVREAFARMARVWQAWGAADCFETHVWPATGHVFQKAQQAFAFAWLERQFALR